MINVPQNRVGGGIRRLRRGSEQHGEGGCATPTAHRTQAAVAHTRMDATLWQRIIPTSLRNVCRIFHAHHAA